MTKDEFKKAYYAFRESRGQINDAYAEAVKPFKDKRDADLAENDRIYADACQAFVKDGSFGSQEDTLRDVQPYTDSGVTERT